MLLGLLLGIDAVARVTNVSARTEHFLSLHFIFIKHGVTGSYATPRTVNSESPTMLATQISAKDADKMWADRASLFHISILLVFEGKLLNHGRYPIPVPSWMVIFSLYIFYVTWAILGHLHIQCGARTSVSHRVTGENICRVTARCGRKRCPNGNISSDTWHASMPQLWNCALSERAGGKVVMLESEKKGTKKVASLGTKITAYLMCQGFNEASQKKSFLWMLKGIVSGDLWHLCQFLKQMRHPLQIPRHSSYFAVHLSTTKFWCTHRSSDWNLRTFGETLLWIFQSNSCSGQKHAGGTEKCHEMPTEILINRV